MKSIQPKTDRNRVRINIYLDKETRDWVVQQAQRLNMSQSQFIVHLVEKMRREHKTVTLKELA